MSEKYCDADKRECEIYLSRIYNLNCRRCGYLRALADAVTAVEKTNVCKFLKCSNIESNNKCFLENNPEFFAACEKIGHFEDAIKAVLAAITALKEGK